MGTNVQDVAARAKQLISERKYQEAVRACRRVLLSKPNEVSVRLLLAQALLALNRHDEVRIEMQALTRKQPDVAAAHRLLAEAYMRGGQKEAAENALKRALQLDAADEDATDLMDELDEVEETPPPETIDRWFTNEPATVETPMAPPSSQESPPATQPSTDHSPTIQLDPEFEREASKEHVAKKKVRTPKATMMGMGAIAPPAAAPPVAPPPKARIPSAPPPAKLPEQALPPPSGEIPAAATRVKRGPKRTMLGMPAALPTPSPTPLQEDETGELDSSALELVAEDVLKKDSTTELQASDLAPAGILDGATDNLSTQELSLIETDGTSELSASDLALGEIDPYEDLAEGLPPLEGEATVARSSTGADLEEFTDEATRQAKARPPMPAPAVPMPAPAVPMPAPAVPMPAPPGNPNPFEAYPDELEGEPTHARPAAIEDDSFDDMPTMARDRAEMDFEDTHGARPSKIKDSDSVEDLATTTARPIVAEFPDDVVDTGLPPLPPLAGEATVARDVSAPRPAQQVGRPTTGKVPTGFAPSAAPTKPPQPPPAKKKPRKKTLANRIAEVRDKVPMIDRVGELPLAGRIALAGIPVLIVALLIVMVKVWSSSQAETAIQAAVDQASSDGLVASVETANELDAEENSDDPEAVARRARLYAMAVLEHGYENDDSQTTARQLAANLLTQLEGEENTNQTDQVAAQIYLALEAGDVERANILADRVQPLGGELAYAKALVYYAQGELGPAADLLNNLEPAARYTGLLARIRAEQGQVDQAGALLEPFPEASPVRALALAQVNRFGSDSVFLSTTTALMDTELLSRASPHQRSWALLLNAEARARDGQRDAIEVAASSEATRPRGDERFVLRLATLYRELGAFDRAANALRLLPEKPARAEARVLVQAEVQLAVRDLAEVARILDSAGESPQTQYLRGRLAEEQGRREEAEAFYTTAAQDAGRFVASKTRLGGMALRAGDAPVAITHLEAAVERAPTNLDVVSLLAEAYVAKPDLDAAVALLENARTRGLDSPRLLVVGARVDLARGEAQSALTTLTSLEAQFGQDAVFLATLGEAARRAGDSARAGQAFERALNVDARNRMALLGTAEIALAATDVEGANGAVARAREAGVEGNALRLLEGRLLVLQGAGAEAVVKLRRLAGRFAGRGRRRRFRLNSNDPIVLTAYGVALAQAESDRNAKTALQRAIRVDSNQIEAQLALATVHTRQGDLNDAGEAAAAAQQIVERQSLGPQYEARVIATRGRILYEANNLRQARELAQQAIAKDDRCTLGHLLNALLDDAEGRSPVTSLRRALEGRHPIPEVLGQLTLLDRGNPDRCDFARRYLEAAPSGIDAADARAVRGRCN